MCCPFCFVAVSAAAAVLQSLRAFFFVPLVRTYTQHTHTDACTRSRVAAASWRITQFALCVGDCSPIFVASSELLVARTYISECFHVAIAHRDRGRFFVALFSSLNGSRNSPPAANDDDALLAHSRMLNAECVISFLSLFRRHSALPIIEYAVKPINSTKLCVECLRSPVASVYVNGFVWASMCGVCVCVCVRFGQRERGCVRKLYLYIIFVYIIISFWFHVTRRTVPDIENRTRIVFRTIYFALNSPHNFRCVLFRFNVNSCLVRKRQQPQPQQQRRARANWISRCSNRAKT